MERNIELNPGALKAPPTMRVKDLLAAHHESQSKPEWEFYDSLIDKPIKLTLLNGKTVVGILVVWTTYALIVQHNPSDFPILYFKHAIQSVER
jgi:sRNA-binding regulator protein Hfq